MDILYHLVIQYGYLGIFIVLMVGIFGIPLPDEFLVLFVGYLVFRGDLQFIPAALAVISGSVCGISVNYLVGRIIGNRILTTLAYFFPKGPQKLSHLTNWLAQSGGIVLFLAYFSPGTRHWAPVGAGIARMSPRVGALYAFPAAVLWALAVIWLGYHLGQEEACLSRTIIFSYLQVMSGVTIISGFLWYFFKRTKRLQRWCSLKKITP